MNDKNRRANAQNVSPDEDSRFGGFWTSAADRHFSDAAFSVLNVVKQLADEKESTPYQIALAWVLNQPGITSPIIGPRTSDHLHGSLKALDIQLTEDDVARLDAAAPPGQMTVPYYGHDGMAWVPWGPHQHQW